LETQAGQSGRRAKRIELFLLPSLFTFFTFYKETGFPHSAILYSCWEGFVLWVHKADVSLLQQTRQY
jgi:hypothetical protein